MDQEGDGGRVSAGGVLARQGDVVFSLVGEEHFETATFLEKKGKGWISFCELDWDGGGRGRKGGT